MRKKIPNALSFLRIVASIALLWINAHSVAFIIVYLACGASDILDGYFVRRYKAASSLGAKIDSVADFVFWIVVIFRLLQTLPLLENYLVLSVLVLTVFLRFVNALVTKLRFGQWGIMHTYGNKTTGILLFIC